MKKQNKIILTISIIVVILLITIGLSFAYFTANITGGEEGTTITVTGGAIKVIYDGGEKINISNIIPSNDPAAVKTFTVTGNNTTDIEMLYQVNLVVEENTFSEKALKFKLISTNTNNNGTTIPSISELTNIEPGRIKLGIGKFDSPTNGNKVHTYNLEIYFPSTGENQNIDQGKIFKGYVEIKEGIPSQIYNEEKGVNHPVLFTGMTPVIWNENEFIATTEGDSNWYDYDAK